MFQLKQVFTHNLFLFDLVTVSCWLVGFRFVRLE